MKAVLSSCGAVLLAAALFPVTAAWAQTSAKPAGKSAATAEEVQQLREALAAQQKQLAEQQARIDALIKLVQTQQPLHAPSLGEVASTTPVLPATKPVDVALPAPAPQSSGADESSPLQLHVGSASITPIGFMDFTSVWRSKDNGSGIATNFAGIPYGNTFQTNLSEFRFSMQNSRIGFRIDADVKGAHVIGYMESDFLGNNPGNVAVSSNSNTFRSRLYWVDVRKGQWEILGGQSWSLMTPNRSGISPLPGDLFFTQNIDSNYQLGLVWGRIPEFRFAYHPSAKAAFAIALDSPEQYVGGSAGGGTPTFPAALTATYPGGELNNGGTTLAVPNRAPDIIVKLALDPSKKFHFEIGGVARQFQTWNPVTSTHYSATGGGGFLNLNLELLKGLRVLTNNYWSDGGGRYIFGQAPDLIARVNGSPSLVHSSSTVDGFEFTHNNTLLYAYYGGMVVGRDAVLDTNGKPVGYGYVGSGPGQNHNVQEGTVGFNQTFWKNPKYGAMNLMGQYSYISRAPWYVAPGQPKNAHLGMAFIDLRYTLPGSAPTLGK